jgi:hypothetical protein
MGEQKLKMRKKKNFPISVKKCQHAEKYLKIIKQYRKNYPFGRKSKCRYYEPPRMCIEICENCGKELNRWKPRK